MAAPQWQQMSVAAALVVGSSTPPSLPPGGSSDSKSSATWKDTSGVDRPEIPPSTAQYDTQGVILGSARGRWLNSEKRQPERSEYKTQGGPAGKKQLKKKQQEKEQLEKKQEKRQLEKYQLEKIKWPSRCQPLIFSNAPTSTNCLKVLRAEAWMADQFLAKVASGLFIKTTEEPGIGQHEVISGG